MIIILTQCFPPRVGGIENLVENLSIELSKTHEVLVLADQHNKSKDFLYDVTQKKHIHEHTVFSNLRRIIKNK